MNKNTKKILLVLLIVIVLAIGGFAIAKVLGGKKENTAYEGADGEDKLPVGGVGVFDFTKEELAYDTIVTDGKRPDYQAYLLDTPQAEALIQKEMDRIQNQKEDGEKNFGQIRQTHGIGKKLYTISAFTTKANDVIKEAFGNMDGVDPNDFRTYPIYGKYQAQGRMLRADLERFVNRPEKEKYRYNFTKWRHWEDNWWWFGSIGLNIMLFNDNADLAKPDKIWWGHVDRKGMDNFKVINRHDVPDKELLKNDFKYPWKGVYSAWGAVRFCEEWLSEMDRLDKITRLAAIDSLEFQGRIIKQKEDKSSTNSTTNTNSNPITTKGGASRV